MEELDINDLKELLAFYRKRSYDLEFELLQSQLKLNKVVALRIAEQNNQVTKPTSEKKSKNNE